MEFVTVAVEQKHRPPVSRRRKMTYSILVEECQDTILGWSDPLASKINPLSGWQAATVHATTDAIACFHEQNTFPRSMQIASRDES